MSQSSRHPARIALGVLMSLLFAAPLAAQPADDPEQPPAAQESEEEEGPQEEEESEEQAEEPATPSPPADEAAEPGAVTTPPPRALTAQELEAQLVEALKRKISAKTSEEAPQPPVVYTLPAGDDAPPLDINAPFLCAYRPNSSVIVHLQCDEEKMRCLMAQEAVFKPKAASQGGSRDEPEYTPLASPPAHMGYCSEVLSAQDFVLFQENYELVPALLEVKHGYKRDARGRAFQTHFDLRSRLLLGVYYTGLAEDGYSQSLTIETRSSYEKLGWERRRHRFSFVEGRLTLSPLQASATLFDYNNGRVGDEPLFYITTLIGEPRRHDVYMRVGKGLTLGRLDYRVFEDAPDQAMLDFVAGRLQWEIAQGLGLEDYVNLSIGVGVGTRGIGNAEAGSIYVYPELGFKAIWLKSPRGLLQLATEGTIRSAWEPELGEMFQVATARASLEWVMVAISDQPISLYLEPEARFTRIPTDDIQRGEWRTQAGIRFNFFTPPPLSPVDIERRLSSGESY